MRHPARFAFATAVTALALTLGALTAVAGGGLFAYEAVTVGAAP